MVAISYQELLFVMSCLNLFFSYFRRGETINGDSYNVVKRIGEGGEALKLFSIMSFEDNVIQQGFSYVDLVTRQHTNYALVSVDRPLYRSLHTSLSAPSFSGL